MTGRYPNTEGIPDVLAPRSLTGIDPSSTTIAEFLKDAGYATAAIGKWHLGDHPQFLPTNNGFDSYFGIPYSNDMSPVVANNPRERARRHPRLPLVRDTTVVEREPDQRVLTRRYTEEALSFIRAHRDRPFFLYFAHMYAHVPLWVPDEVNGLSAGGLYGDVMEEIDRSVGDITRLLDELHLRDNTIVFFSSDNGPWLVFGEHAGSAGPFREGKATSFEGGHRVPGIFSWPGRIPGGGVSDQMASVLDLFPTLASVLYLPTPDSLRLHGTNIWPYLRNSEAPLDTARVFFYFRAGQLQAVRRGRWKLHVPHAYASIEQGQVGAGGFPGQYISVDLQLSLFDLETDPGESINVAGRHPALVQELESLIESGRRRFGDTSLGVTGTDSHGPGRVVAPWSVQID